MNLFSRFFWLSNRAAVLYPLLLLLLTSYASSQSLEGDWRGTLSAPGGTLPLIFHLDGTGGGTVDSPAQHFTGQLQYSMSGNRVTISVAQVGGTYSGTLSLNQMSGTWSQNGQSLPLTLTKGRANAQSGDGSRGSNGASTLRGDWSGTLKAPNGDLPLVFHLDGNGGGTVDSLAQHFTGQLQYSMDGDKISVTVPQVGGAYSATLAGNQMKGAWSQNGQSLPLNLTKQ